MRQFVTFVDSVSHSLKGLLSVILTAMETDTVRRQPVVKKEPHLLYAIVPASRSRTTETRERKRTAGGC